MGGLPPLWSGMLRAFRRPRVIRLACRAAIILTLSGVLGTASPMAGLPLAPDERAREYAGVRGARPRAPASGLAQHSE
jgi:hypothetical protein